MDNTHTLTRIDRITVRNYSDGSALIDFIDLDGSIQACRSLVPHQREKLIEALGGSTTEPAPTPEPSGDTFITVYVA